VKYCLLRSSAPEQVIGTNRCAMAQLPHQRRTMVLSSGGNQKQKQTSFIPRLVEGFDITGLSISLEYLQQ
jgi:hypothetical protein